ncbi:MAG: EMC3/TMCO1 family protein [Candidatus Nanohaloarchaea archaeon]
MATGIQAILTGLFGFYDTLFQPLLAAGPYVSLGFFSAALAGMFSLIHWHLLDIERADELKDKLSEHQDKMKEARDNNNSDKASDHMQKTMKLNQELMKLNMRPMIGTMLFVILIFPWLGATYAPTVTMNQTDTGIYTGQLEYAGQTQALTVDNTSAAPVVKLDGQEARINEEIDALGINWQVARFGTKSGGLFSSGGGTVLKLNAEFVKLPFTLPLVGSALNWLGFYILIAMPLTYGLRKVLGVA